MLNQRIKDYYLLQDFAGDVGVEIEMEGNNLVKENNILWRVDRDGSLRGEAQEYVTKKPLSWDEAKEAIDYLFHNFEKTGSQLNPSIRCGIHIHINFQQKTFLQLANFIAVYRYFEPMLLHYCGPNRNGNLFCLGFHHADAMEDMIFSAFNSGEYNRFADDIIRYSALNLCSLPKYGSVEFRAFQTPDNANDIADNIHILKWIMGLSTYGGSPKELLDWFVGAKDKEMFLRYVPILDSYSKTLSEEEKNNLINIGIRGFKDFVFSHENNWGVKDGVIENGAAVPDLRFNLVPPKWRVDFDMQIIDDIDIEFDEDIDEDDDL